MKKLKPEKIISVTGPSITEKEVNYVAQAAKDGWNKKMFYISKGFAHGFQTLEDNTEVFYQMSEFFHPECARGVRWDDSAFGIQWPIPKPITSEKDKKFRVFKK